MRWVLNNTCTSKNPGAVTVDMPKSKNPGAVIVDTFAQKGDK